MIYVDDLKLAGPNHNLTQGWVLLRKGLSIEAETQPGVYLGCTQKREVTTMKNGRTITTMSYDMEDYLGSCVTRYLELAGKDTKLRHVNTPFLPEETRDGPAGRPASANGVEIKCPHCHTAQAVPDTSCSWCKKGFVSTYYAS